MDRESLTVTERRIWDAFTTGRRVDLTGEEDRRVRAELLTFLLLGGVPDHDGERSALRITGAMITGDWKLAYVDVAAPISLRQCVFKRPMYFSGTRFRRISLDNCVFPGFIASNAVVEGGMRLRGVRSTGTIRLIGARIEGALTLSGAELTAPDYTVDATRIQIGSDVYARHGFHSTGEIRIDHAEIGGSLRWEGATLSNPGGRVLDARGIRVVSEVRFRNGFTADGRVDLRGAQIGGEFSADDAVLDGVPESLTLGSVTAREFILSARQPPAGAVDLSHARVEVLRDDPASWPASLSLNGLTYGALSGTATVADRLRWLQRDSPDFPPQVYSQLAAVYRATGRDDDARTVALAGEQHRRRTLRPAGRIWGLLQDGTVGYGYRPVRAVAWLGVLLAIGTLVFAQWRPRPAEAPKAPEFHAAAYAADLLFPVIDLGQQSTYLPQGWTAWFAYFLIGAGLLLATTAVAGAARRLQRG
ncbi:hypothetical protein FB565_006476 [Actinoplanes lutulentus]|uniref:Membrane-associated oxidoreductase n=1 Tax=Actinoplanes lutulentus TaxID=1287878 RepID=A0A327Z945_9ACTN|nr:hypothetical protein [Actinoplanes lutulentus]MBB2946708.1 hypothetical protein [Actinoplanes lutulentus]RAK35600.1 hypothetical protein B0I29_10973 [Actinoplanes lutulentus]